MQRLVVSHSFPLCPRFSALSSARLCSSPVLSVNVCIYFYISFLWCLLYCLSLLGFPRIWDFTFFRSSKTPRYFDELVKTFSALSSHQKIFVSLVSHQALTDRHNRFLSQSDKPSECSRLKEEPTIFHFVLAWREGFPEIPRESRGVKGLGRVIGVFYHLLWTHKRA